MNLKINYVKVVQQIVYNVKMVIVYNVWMVIWYKITYVKNVVMDVLIVI